MKNFNNIANDLFNKIRGRFPNVTIGDTNGNVTNVPEDARYFDFSFTNQGVDLGQVSVSINEDDGLVIVVGKDITEYQTEDVQDRWYNFLKELRIFAKKRLMSFDIRDINKSNLNKEDYKFLATNRAGENTMSESTMYGTNKTSYQKIGNARLAVKHTQPINLESTSGRTQKIGAIYIESPEGERFKYPFKHLSGARAMARHVSEGGNAYDDFGKHITGLSEEISKLRKFTQYISRSAVMAEGLKDYTGIVKERVAKVKKEIQNLQKESFYRESIANFIVPVVEEVPSDVSENWIDQLTIKQFNEELKDVFPYIYNLVSEATKAKELGAADLIAEMDCWESGNEEVELDEVSSSTLGSYISKADANKQEKDRAKGIDLAVRKKHPSLAAYNKKSAKVASREEIELESGFESMMGQFSEAENDVGIAWMEKHDPYIEYHINAANAAHKAGNEEERNNHKELAKAHRRAQIQWEMNINDGKAQTMSTKAIQASKAMGADIGEAKGKDYDNDGDVDSDDYMKAKDIAIKKAMGDEKKTPIGEFILSYFDRHSGQFPKGETAVLTMIEKDYGEEFIEPAKAFIEQVNNLVAEHFGFKEPEIQEDNIDNDYYDDYYEYGIGEFDPKNPPLDMPGGYYYKRTGSRDDIVPFIERNLGLPHIMYFDDDELVMHSKTIATLDDTIGEMIAKTKAFVNANPKYVKTGEDDENESQELNDISRLAGL